MSHIISFFDAIPEVIWSAVIGALVALSGVVISNRGNSSRLQIQLQHDEQEKGKERTLSLRREVYLRVAEELVKANIHLGNLPGLDPKNVNINEGFKDFFSAAARLQLIAEPKAALLINELIGRYGELILDLLVKLHPAHVAKSSIEIADYHYQRSQDEVSRVLAEMTRLNESVNRDARIFEALQASFDFHQGQSEKFSSDRNQGWLRFNSANISFQKSLLGKLKEVHPLQVAVMIEMRKDLGLSGEIDELERQMQNQIAQMERRLDKFIDNLSAHEPSFGSGEI